MENCVSNTRTVKVMGEGGAESFTTVVLTSLHYESHLMATNCGPLGLKADVEPVDQPRGALGPLVGAHRALERTTTRRGDVDFDVQNVLRGRQARRSTGTACCSCLVAYVLIFIKHIPACQPNLTYANLLCNKWDEILWTEYNLPRPSKRKKIKLRMMLELFAAESAVFEKFGCPRRRIDFGHAPDAQRPPVALLHRAAGGRGAQPAALPRPRGHPQRRGRTRSTTRPRRRRTSSR